jgi:hypothetical protein
MRQTLRFVVQDVPYLDLVATGGAVAGDEPAAVGAVDEAGNGIEMAGQFRRLLLRFHVPDDNTPGQRGRGEVLAGRMERQAAGAAQKDGDGLARVQIPQDETAFRSAPGGQSMPG